MCCGILKAGGGLGAIVALILVVVALLKQLIALVGFLLAAVKIAIVVIFIALLVMIVLAIFRDRSRRRLIDEFKNLIFFLRLSYIFLPKLQHLQTCVRFRAVAGPAGWVSPRRDLEVSIHPLQIFSR